MSVRKDTKEEQKKIETIESGILTSNDDEYHDVTKIMLNSIERAGREVSGIYPENPALAAINQAKENITTAAEEAKEFVPSFMNKLQFYQALTIQLFALSAKNYIDVQSQIIESWLPHWEKTANMFWTNFYSPQRVAELYANLTSGFMNSIISSSSGARNTVLSSLQAYSDSVRKFSDMTRACSNLTFFEKNKEKKAAAKAKISTPETTSTEQ
jgi:hypothetical protein